MEEEERFIYDVILRMGVDEEAGVGDEQRAASTRSMKILKERLLAVNIVRGACLLDKREVRLTFGFGTREVYFGSRCTIIVLLVRSRLLLLEP